MDMAIQDRRIQRTQHALATALIALTLEKGYDSISIRDITERANIGYATFFRHYTDKKALLHDVMNVVLNELMAMLAPMTGTTDPAITGTMLFHYVQSHNELIRVLLSTHGTSSIMHYVVETGAQNVLSEHSPRAESTIPGEIAAYHIVTSTIALIQWWLDHAMPYSPERMGTIYRDLIIQPTSQAAFQN